MLKFKGQYIKAMFRKHFSSTFYCLGSRFLKQNVLLHWQKKILLKLKAVDLQTLVVHRETVEKLIISCSI